ncbi:MAG: hypothetical protein AAF597_12825, partial [Bacteroidota bacterium]
MNRIIFLLWGLLFSCQLAGQVKLVIAGNTADAESDFYAALGKRLAEPTGPKHVLLAGDYVAECTGAMLDYKPGNTGGD